MQTRIVITVLLLILAVSGAAGQDAQVFLSLEEAPSVVFPGADSTERIDVPSDEALRTRMQELIGRDTPSIWEPFYITYVARKDGVTSGYAVVCEELGKHRPITFIVAADPDGEVTDVAVMMYREPRGGEVRYPGFSKQFQGKTLADPIAHRRDIKNVSGATLSSRAMARGVRKALAFMQIVYLRK